MNRLKDFGRAAKNITSHMKQNAELFSKLAESTSNKPWGASGSLKHDISEATYDKETREIVMNYVWKRVDEPQGKDWRRVYKALQLLEYLLLHGDESIIEQATRKLFYISTLKDFRFTDENHVDQGLNVRVKSEKLVSLLKDRESLDHDRKQALDNEGKYYGVSNTGEKTVSKRHEAGSGRKMEGFGNRRTKKMEGFGSSGQGKKMEGFGRDSYNSSHRTEATGFSSEDWHNEHPDNTYKNSGSKDKSIQKEESSKPSDSWANWTDDSTGNTSGKIKFVIKGKDEPAESQSNQIIDFGSDSFNSQKPPATSQGSLLDPPTAPPTSALKHPKNSPSKGFDGFFEMGSQPVSKTKSQQSISNVLDSFGLEPSSSKSSTSTTANAGMDFLNSLGGMNTQTTASSALSGFGDFDSAPQKIQSLPVKQPSGPIDPWATDLADIGNLANSFGTKSFGSGKTKQNQSKNGSINWNNTPDFSSASTKTTPAPAFIATRNSFGSTPDFNNSNSFGSGTAPDFNISNSFGSGSPALNNSNSTVSNNNAFDDFFNNPTTSTGTSSGNMNEFGNSTNNSANMNDFNFGKTTNSFSSNTNTNSGFDSFGSFPTQPTTQSTNKDPLADLFQF